MDSLNPSIFDDEQMQKLRFLSYDEQIQKLKDKGFLITDEEFCRTVLSEINYYRLKGYLLPFRKTSKNGIAKTDKDGNRIYRRGINFIRIYRLYKFDCELRNLFLSVIEQIEIYVRAKIVHYHANKYRFDGYLKKETFSANNHNHEKFLKRLKHDVHQNHPVVQHYDEKYQGILPLWVISEFFTLGTISKFYADMILKDKEKIASELYHTIPKNLKSWLQCATDIRNICAHGGRLYYRLFTSVPVGLNLSKSQETRLWGAVKTLQVLYPDKEEWNTKILPQLYSLFYEYKNDIERHHIAFPRDWWRELKN